MSAITDRLNENLARLGVQLDHFTLMLQKLDETVNGTAKTGGLKERIAMAEGEIKKNKESFDKINENISSLRTEMLIEVGKLSATANKKRGINWESVLQAVVTALAVGVTGIVFWQLIIWLAANAPVR